MGVNLIFGQTQILLLKAHELVHFTKAEASLANNRIYDKVQTLMLGELETPLFALSVENLLAFQRQENVVEHSI
jgi:hypothetical protein